MKKLFTAICIVGTVGVSSLALAEETTTKTKATVEKESDGAHSKVKSERKTTVDAAAHKDDRSSSEEMKAETNPTASGGSETNIDKTATHKAAGKTHKSRTKEKVVKDADGNVVSDQKTTPNP